MVSGNYEELNKSVKKILTAFDVEEQYNDGIVNPKKVEAVGDLLLTDFLYVESLNGTENAGRYSVDFVNSLTQYLQNKLDNTWINSPKL